MAQIMSVLSALWAFMKMLPQVWEVLKEVYKIYKDYQDKKELEKKKEEIIDAIKHSQETKDTSKLENIFGINGLNFRLKVVETEEKPIIEEKKSLKINNLAFSLKGIKTIDDSLVVESLASEEIVEPEVSSGGFFKSFSFGSNMSSARGIGASFFVNNKINGASRMTSKFYSLFLLLFVLSSCKSPPKPNQPDYKPKLYAGDSANISVTRKQSGEVIQCSDPRFDKFVAMRYEELSCIYETYIQNCERFKTPYVRCSGQFTKEAKEYINKNLKY